MYGDFGKVSLFKARRISNEVQTPRKVIRVGSVLKFKGINGSLIGENISQFIIAPIDTAIKVMIIIGVVI